MGVAKGFQLLHSVGAAASGAAVHQPQGVFVRQHLGGAVDDLPQRQQLCPRDVPYGVFFSVILSLLKDRFCSIL